MKLVGCFFKGFDCCPKLFTQDNGGNLTFITDLDIPQEKEAGKIRYVHGKNKLIFNEMMMKSAFF
jgi:hypothetical protein